MIVSKKGVILKVGPGFADKRGEAGTIHGGEVGLLPGLAYKKEKNPTAKEMPPNGAYVQRGERR